MTARVDGSCRHESQVLFMFFEDLKSDLRRQVDRVADFLGIPKADEEVRR